MRKLFFALMLSTAVSAHAQSPTPVGATTATAATPSPATQTPPRGQVESAAAVADPVFGVHAKALGLERGVEMLQWRKVGFPAPPHYEQAWTAERIDSSGFDAAHRNPGDLPFNGERWWTVEPKLDGHPVSPDVLAALAAWTPLKPDLSQLPTNLAVSFQPDGDWLSTSQDPAHPQVGDVRVHWRVIERAPAPAGTTLVAGRWELPVGAAAAGASAVAPPSASTVPDGEVGAWVRRMFGDHLTWWVAGVLVLGLLLLALKRRR